MKKLFLSVILIAVCYFSYSQEQYSRVRLYAGHDELMKLAANGLIIDHGEFKAGKYVICELSGSELEIADRTGISYDVLVEDVTKFYEERNRPYLSRLDEVRKMTYDLSDEWPVPEGFELGTCGGFFTIDQAMAHLDEMAEQYPELISPRQELDFPTHNGRELYWVRLSDNPNMNEDEPEVLYTGMHHAREGIGMQLLFYYMYYLLENYDTDPDVKYIVDNFELYFVPIVNMDGYAYNIITNSGGGGQWRKNRRQNDDGSYGVDINRNYGYMWGYDNNGSSPVPDDDTYRGPSAFSEPETQCMKNFCEEHQFRIALNYHSYSNLLLYPWGYSNDLCEDDYIFHTHGGILTRENGYTYGPGSTTIYITNGGSDDWMYGEQQTKDRIFSYTSEVGNGDQGFWPPVTQIIPLCQANMYQNIMAAKLSGPYATVRDLSTGVLQYKSGFLFFEFQRLGLQDSAVYTISIEPLNDGLETVSQPFIYENIEIFETDNAAFTYQLREDIQNGDPVEYLLSVNDGLYTFSDTIRKVYGTPEIIFADSANNFDNWTSNKWNTTVNQYHSPAKSIADSPYGQYSNQENNIMTLNDPIDLTGYAYASLEFWAKWNIEAGYDYVQVLISDVNTGIWTPMEGKFTHPGNSSQALGLPVYDGVQSNWVKEEINLGQYLDKQIKIRFVLRSDTYEVADGFYWDDMTVTVVDSPTGVGIKGNAPDQASKSYLTVYPNPAGENVNFHFTGTFSGDYENMLKIFDLTGREIYREKLIPGQDNLGIDVSSWMPGIYFYCDVRSGLVIGSGKLIIR